MTIVVAGATGLAGSAIVRAFEKAGKEVVGINRSVVDLLDLPATKKFLKDVAPSMVIDAAARVGGIGANNAFPVEFLTDNIRIQSNLMDAAHEANVERFIFLGSSCIYPRDCAQPIKEEYLMTGPLEPTNDAYSLAKISGYYMCKKYTEQYGFKTVSVMPNNLYGINDNFILSECHVIPSLINKFVHAKEKNESQVMCFGDGSPTREFLFSDDLASGCLFLMNNYDSPEIINIGPNREVSIKDLSELIAELVGYDGEIVWDTSKPNGTPRRALDTSKMDSMGWKSTTSLEHGLKMTIDWFMENRNTYVRI